MLYAGQGTDMGFLNNGSGIFYNYCYNSWYFDNRGSQVIRYHHLYEGEIPNECSMLLGMHDSYKSRSGIFVFHFRTTTTFYYIKCGSLN